jgi:hypothetical protein
MIGLYPKYIVYRWPVKPLGIEPDIHAVYLSDFSVGPEGPGEVWEEMEQVQVFTFVLKPDTDQHARVAIAAYAESVRPTDPRLAADLDEAMSEEMNDADR